MISRPARLRRERYALAIDQEETAFVPFEDIAVIVLDHREITLTHPVLSACAEYGISLFATGHNHQPSGVFVPFLAHSRSTRMMRKQLGLCKPAAKRAWASVVRQKIQNQAKCLELSEKDGTDRLSSYARRVRSGDPENLEAQAAAFYFAQLFEKRFSRTTECWVNAALDYGYAVIRGALARALVAHGLHPTIGLFHDSEQNAFNLADDLIEPFRPVIDLHVARQSIADDTDLRPADKRALVALLNVDVSMPQGAMSVLSAIEYAVESAARVFEQKSRHIECPGLLGLQQHASEC